MSGVLGSCDVTSHSSSTQPQSTGIQLKSVPDLAGSKPSLEKRKLYLLQRPTTLPNAQISMLEQIKPPAERARKRYRAGVLNPIDSQLSTLEQIKPPVERAKKRYRAGVLNPIDSQVVVSHPTPKKCEAVPKIIQSQSSQLLVWTDAISGHDVCNFMSHSTKQLDSIQARPVRRLTHKQSVPNTIVQTTSRIQVSRCPMGADNEKAHHSSQLNSKKNPIEVMRRPAMGYTGSKSYTKKTIPSTNVVQMHQSKTKPESIQTRRRNRKEIISRPERRYSTKQLPASISRSKRSYSTKKHPAFSSRPKRSYKKKLSPESTRKHSAMKRITECRGTLNVEITEILRRGHEVKQFVVALSKPCNCGARHSVKTGCRANVKRLCTKLSEVQVPGKRSPCQAKWPVGMVKQENASAVGKDCKRCHELELRTSNTKCQLDVAQREAMQARQLLEEHDSQLTRERTQWTLERVNWTHARGEWSEFREEWTMRLSKLENCADTLAKRLDQADDMRVRLKRIEDTTGVLTGRMQDCARRLMETEAADLRAAEPRAAEVRAVEPHDSRHEAKWRENGSCAYSKWEPSSPPVKRSEL